MTSALVISASYDKQIRFWDVASGRTVRCFTFPDSQVNALLLIPDTTLLAVAGFGVVRVYDIGTSNAVTVGPNGMGPGAGGGGGVAGGQGAANNQAPPVITSFESQSSMNVTSLGSFPLVISQDYSMNNSNDSSPLLDASIAVGMSLILDTVLLPANHDVGVVLYATSEDGHIRFFDAKSPTTLRILKDIATGAAVTCSALSPDRRFLLTGSQIGQITVWHLPSIVASAAAQRNATDARRGSHGGDKAGGDATAGAADHPNDDQPPANGANPTLFGNKPLQEVAFDGDYSAIRSVAIEPLGQWAAVASNAGKLHFLRFSHDARIGGTKAVKPALTDGAAGVAFSSAHRGSGEGAANELLATSKPAGGTTATSSSSPTPEAGAVSILPLRGGSRGTHEEGHNRSGPREAIYRSALVVSELSHVRRGSEGASGGGGGGAGSTTGQTPTGGNSMGAALLNSLEQHHAFQNSLQNMQQGYSSLNSPAEQHTTPSGAAADADAAAAGTDASRADASAGARGVLGSPNGTPDRPLPRKTTLQEELELEEFHSFQAHYKYILKVAISPDSGLLVTCSADYTIGRFEVPKELRVARSSQFASRTALQSESTTSTTTNTVGGDATATAVGSVLDEAVGTANRSAALSVDNPSLASTQAPGRRVDPIALSGTFDPADSAEHTTIIGTEDIAITPPPATQQQHHLQLQQSGTASPPGQPHIGEAKDGAQAGKAAGGAEVSSVVSSGTPSQQQQQQQDAQSTALGVTAFRPLTPLSAHTRWVWDCVFSECSRFLFTASSDSAVRMWNGLLSERPQSLAFTGHTKPVVALVIYYDKKRGANTP